MKYMFVFAHPDDETVACASTIKQLADNGDEVYLILATMGEAGEVMDGAQANLNRLGSVAALRKQELNGAVKHLGIKQVINLSFSDGEINNKMVWGKLLTDLIEHIDQLKPDCIITFDHTGWYFHLDHVGVSIATTLAYHQSEHRADILMHSHYHPTTDGEEKWKYIFHPSPATHGVEIIDKEHKLAAINFHQSQDLSRPRQYLKKDNPGFEYYELAFASKAGQKWLLDNPLFKKIDK